MWIFRSRSFAATLNSSLAVWFHAEWHTPCCGTGNCKQGVSPAPPCSVISEENIESVSQTRHNCVTLWMCTQSVTSIAFVCSRAASGGKMRLWGGGGGALLGCTGRLTAAAVSQPHAIARRAVLFLFYFVHFTIILFWLALCHELSVGGDIGLLCSMNLLLDYIYVLLPYALGH